MPLRNQVVMRLRRTESRWPVAVPWQLFQEVSLEPWVRSPPLCQSFCGKLPTENLAGMSLKAKEPGSSHALALSTARTDHRGSLEWAQIKAAWEVSTLAQAGTR